VIVDISVDPRFQHVDEDLCRVRSRYAVRVEPARDRARIAGVEMVARTSERSSGVEQRKAAGGGCAALKKTTSGVRACHPPTSLERGGPYKV
jgi:hypothetical protein